MRRIQADVFLKESKAAVILDVRSPQEYNHAHFPGAINLPLFTDEERKVVGTTYKQQSRQQAIKTGLDYFGPKMRSMVEQVEELISNRQLAISNNSACPLPVSNCVFIYCWRGGMRSGAVSWLLNLYGFKVTVLAGGYKAFRNHVLRSFHHPYQFNVLGGYTGSGKTELLHRLQQQGEAVIDLEALASHKGSAFGNIGMPVQPSQEMFENGLAVQLLSHNDDKPAANDDETILNKVTKPVWIEDESQRIGNLNIPKPLWLTMRQSPIIFLNIPFEERLQHIAEEYETCPIEKLESAIDRIKKRVGPLESKTALQHLQEGNRKECFRILLQYYDKQYRKGLHNRTNLSHLLQQINSETVTGNNISYLIKSQPIP